MRSKSAPEHSVKISDAASKFMFFMAFIKSASRETLRSYRGDISQAFGLTDAELPRLAELEGIETGRLRSPGKPLKLDESALLDACRNALQGWSRLAPASRNRKAATLKSFLGWLFDERSIERDLALQIHAPKVPIRLPHHLSVDEALALLADLKKRRDEAIDEPTQASLVRDLALILLLYGGGLRISEACALERSQVSEGSRILRVRGKGGKERVVALPPMAADALWALMKQTSGTFVFGVEPIATRKAYEIVRSSAAIAGLVKPLHPHALRHSFATHLLSSGANLRTLQELLGHSSLQATQRYTHLGIDQLARTLEDFHPLSNPSTGPFSGPPTGRPLGRRKKS
jgi:site-specific recombinase XerD